MKTVYYHVVSDNGTTMMFVTSKDFWDANRCLDDGGPDYDAIMAAMDACGAYEAMESVFELNGPEDTPRIVAAMKEHGFDLVQNEDFSRAMADDGDG